VLLSSKLDVKGCNGIIPSFLFDLRIIVHSKQYTVNSTQYTVHSTQHRVNSKQFSACPYTSYRFLLQRLTAFNARRAKRLFGTALFIRTDSRQRGRAASAVIAEKGLLTAPRAHYPERNAAGGTPDPIGLDGRAAAGAARRLQRPYFAAEGTGR
jgi:hypothetical protein